LAGGPRADPRRGCTDGSASRRSQRSRRPGNGADLRRILSEESCGKRAYVFEPAPIRREVLLFVMVEDPGGRTGRAPSASTPKASAEAAGSGRDEECYEVRKRCGTVLIARRPRGRGPWSGGVLTTRARHRHEKDSLGATAGVPRRLDRPAGTAPASNAYGSADEGGGGILDDFGWTQTEGSARAAPWFLGADRDVSSRGRSERGRAGRTTEAGISGRLGGHSH